MKMLAIKRRIVIYDKIFGNEICCCIGYDEGELNALLKKHYNCNEAIKTDGFDGVSFNLVDTKDRSRFFVIWLRKMEWH
ncbi:MAG: hypothetical protein QME51_11155, partial [Planctomycetota bacterium]|nr:hypothetical protein [Planctomycetota bacterium]